PVWREGSGSGHVSAHAGAARGNRDSRKLSACSTGRAGRRDGSAPRGVEQMSLWSRIKHVIRPGSYEDEIREELGFHLKMDQANGHDMREARLRLGNP